MKMNIILPGRLNNRRNSLYGMPLERELRLQRELNAGLLEKCELQSRLLEEQSLMISEILGVMGK